MDGVGLLQAAPVTDPVTNLRIFLDLQHLLEEQVTVMDRRAFAQRKVVCQLFPFLNQHALLRVIHTLVTSLLDYCNAIYMGLPLKSNWKLPLVRNAGAQTVLYKYVLPICFLVQFKVLVITFKTLHHLGMGHLKDHLSPLCPPTHQAWKAGYVKDLISRIVHLVGPQKTVFLVVAPSLWYNILTKI